MKMAVKHKEIKRCVMIMQAMVKDHNMGPGTLFAFKGPFHFQKYNVEINEQKVVTTESLGRHTSSYLLPPGEPILFVDVVYDPYLRRHFLRFLHKDQMIAVPFKKRETIKHLKTKVIAPTLENNSDG